MRGQVRVRKAPPQSMWLGIMGDPYCGVDYPHPIAEQGSTLQRTRMHTAGRYCLEEPGEAKRRHTDHRLPRARAEEGAMQSSAKDADCHRHDCDALELGTVTDIQRGENI